MGWPLDLHAAGIVSQPAISGLDTSRAAVRRPPGARMCLASVRDWLVVRSSLGLDWQFCSLLHFGALRCIGLSHVAAESQLVRVPPVGCSGGFGDCSVAPYATSFPSSVIWKTGLTIRLQARPGSRLR